MAAAASIKAPRRPSYDDRIVIKRDRNGWEVQVCDPELVTYNQSRGDNDYYVDPSVEYNFETKDQVLAFIGAVIDKALPDDSFGSTFDNLAKEAIKS
jgi:hypothetical protein